MKKQIGWYHLKESRIFQNLFECAAWYENVLVEAGKYPVYVYDFRVESDNKIGGHCYGTYTAMNGTVVSDEFGARYFGMPISDYDNFQNSGKESKHSMFSYMHDIADSIINNAESSWELFPEYEAKEIHGEWNGKPYTSHAIYKIQSKEG